jgi:hypothetical protein
VTDASAALQVAVAAVGAAVVAAIAISRHYTASNLVQVVVGFAIFLGVLGWTDPNPDLHIYKVGLAAIGTAMWVSALRDEERRKKNAEDSRRPL